MSSKFKRISTNAESEASLHLVAVRRIDAPQHSVRPVAERLQIYLHALTAFSRARLTAVHALSFAVHRADAIEDRFNALAEDVTQTRNCLSGWSIWTDWGI
jgi:hypothetical protein